MEFCLFTGSFHSRPGFRRSLATGALWRAGGRARGHGIARIGARCYGDIRLEPRYVGLLCVAAAAACRGLEPRYTSPPARPAPPRPATKYRTVVHCTVQTTVHCTLYTPAICVVVTRRYPPQLDSGTHNTAHLALTLACPHQLFYFKLLGDR